MPHPANDPSAEPMEFDFAAYLARRLDARRAEVDAALGAVLMHAEAERYRVRAEAAASIRLQRRCFEPGFPAVRCQLAGGPAWRRS